MGSPSQLEERFSSIFNHSPIPISLSRLSDGKLVDVNDAFLRFAGYSREEVIGRTPVELDLYVDLAQRAFILGQMRAHGHLHGFEQRFRTKTGEERTNLLWLDVITVDGEPHVLAMSLDVTEQKRAAKQQKELEEQLRQAQKLEALGTLAGGIAHDFNNILGAIISYTELSRFDRPDDAELQENLAHVLQACNRATTLIRQILSFSRRQKHERRLMELGPVVEEVMKLLRATLPSTIEIQQSIGSDVPSVLGSATQLHQVLMNLCTNAAHAMKGRQGRLRVVVDVGRLPGSDATPPAELPEGEYVRLVVSDTGHGMDDATLRRVFEPFFTTKAAGEGTGLGLSVVHGIVKEHDGAIAVESTPGTGTTFTLYLPARRATELVAPLATAELPRGKGQRVAIVDDEPVLADVARKILIRLGYDPVVFRGSEAAWEAIERDPHVFDVLITDLTMPVMTGVDLARKVSELRPGLPIILMSGSGGAPPLEEVRSWGIRDVVGKPLDLAAFARVMGRVLGQP